MVVGDSNSTKSLPGLSICYHHPSIIIIYKHQAVIQVISFQIEMNFVTKYKILGCVAVTWHFEFYIQKCKKILIDFLDELGHFKQKNDFLTFC